MVSPTRYPSQCCSLPHGPSPPPQLWATKPDAVKEAEWLQDFTYLYDEAEGDHASLVGGEPVSSSEIESALGPRSEWRRIPRSTRSASGLLIRAAGVIRENLGLDKDLAASLEECGKWRLGPEERAELLGD